MELTNKRLRVTQSDKIMGIIPSGNQELTFPIIALSGVNTTKRIRYLRAFIGMIFFLLALSAFGDSFLFGLILLLLSAYLLVTTIVHDLVITNEAGQQTHLQVYVFEGSKVQSFSQAINNTIIEVKTR